MSELEPGWIAPDVRAEFPELRLWSLHVAASPGDRTTEGLRRRLRVLSDRFHGAKAIQLRTDPIPHAYRVFFRLIGIDPDKDRVPIEAAVLARLKHGGFRSHGRLPDALSVALVETGVPLWALDAERIEGALGIDTDDDQLAVVDAAGPICTLFAEPGPGHAPSPETSAIVLFAVQPAGVPPIHVEEALWMAAEGLSE